MLAALDCGLFRSAEGRFGFRHDLLREAALADLDDTRRALLHEALAGAPGVRAGEAARHLRLAGRDDLAVERLVQAAADAARATALVEAVAYLQEAIELRPDDPQIHVELAGMLAQLGRRDPAMAEIDTALRLLGPDDAAARVDAHLSAALWFRSALCDPTRALHAAQDGLIAYQAGGLDDRELLGEMLLIRAWTEVTIGGASAADDTLAELDALGLDLETPSLRRHYLETVRGFKLIAEGRLERGRAGAGQLRRRRRARRPPGPGVQRLGERRLHRLRRRPARARARAGAARGAQRRGHPHARVPDDGLVAYTLARLGRHDEARAACDRQTDLAERIASAELALVADHDAGLLALLAGDHERAAELLGRALAGDPPVQRAEARLRRAEALARLGRADEADAEIRAAALEPMRAMHRPGVLVARMAFAQALSARARGDHELAERRLREAEAQWRRLAGEDDASREHLASLVDLGRPPVTGVVDPAAELERVAEEAHARVR